MPAWIEAWIIALVCVGLLLDAVPCGQAVLRSLPQGGGEEGRASVWLAGEAWLLLALGLTAGAAGAGALDAPRALAGPAAALVCGWAWRAALLVGRAPAAGSSAGGTCAASLYLAIGALQGWLLARGSGLEGALAFGFALWWLLATAQHAALWLGLRARGSSGLLVGVQARRAYWPALAGWFAIWIARGALEERARSAGAHGRGLGWTATGWTLAVLATLALCATRPLQSRAAPRAALGASSLALVASVALCGWSVRGFAPGARLSPACIGLFAVLSLAAALASARLWRAAQSAPERG